MTQLLKLNPGFQSKFQSHLHTLPLYTSRFALIGSSNPKWIFLQQHLRSDGRYFCLFSDGSKKQEQARKALESALGGKKSEFEKWDKEIEKRKERSGGGGGGASGGGGWFGGGRWFGWFSDDRFWAEAQQAILTIIGIISLYLLLVKGNVMFAVVSNSLLYVLRGTRNSFAFASSKLAKATSTSSSNVELEPNSSASAYESKISAKERVVRKWGTD